nr:transcription elongation factor SPT6 homolog [Tanacetum cinerariifolium]
VCIISQVMKKMKWSDFIVDDEVKDVYNVQSRRNGNKKKPGRVREPTIFFETIRTKKPKVKDEFEPIVNSEKYLTKEDDNIRKTDILERMQLLDKPTYLCKTRIFALGDKPHSFFALEGKPPRRGLNPRPLACGNNLPKA